MKTAYSRVCLASLAIASLTACGTSSNIGGVGGVGVTVTPNFTSWTSSVGSGKTLVVAGDSQQGTYSFNTTTNRVTATTVGAQQPGAVLTIVYTTSTAVLPNFWAKDVTFQPASGTGIHFTRTGPPPDNFFVPNDFINFDYYGIVSNNQSNYILVADDGLFNYQSYGIWTTGAGTASGTHGAVSVGAPSPVGVIPTEGLATYSGSAGGRYVASDGSFFFTSANMVAAANFFTRELTFTTNSTSQVADIVTGFGSVNNALDMTGTLGLIPGTNQFSGTISTPGGVMTGTAKGRFYGPAAQEIGGTFSVIGTGVEAYVGGFGGNK